MILRFCSLNESVIASTISEFLRPSYLVVVCSDAEDEKYIKFFEAENTKFVHEVRLPYQDFRPIHGIWIPECQKLACAVSAGGHISLGWFNMQTGDLRQVRRMERHPGYYAVAYVPREGLIVLGTNSGLSLFDHESLAFAGSIGFAGPYYLGCVRVTSMLGAFMHDSLASCVVVGSALGGLYIANVEHRSITRTISLPQLPVDGYAATNALENLALAPSGCHIAFSRDTHLYVVDLRTDEFAEHQHCVPDPPTCVTFVSNSRIAVSDGADIITVDSSSGDLLQRCVLRSDYFPVCCLNLLHPELVMVACVEAKEEYDGCLCKVQTEPPFTVEYICESNVHSMFIA